MSDYITVNRELLALVATRNGGYTKAQLSALGVAWPPPRGWKKSVVGRGIDRTAFDFLVGARSRQSNERGNKRTMKGETHETEDP